MKRLLSSPRDCRRVPLGLVPKRPWFAQGPAGVPTRRRPHGRIDRAQAVESEEPTLMTPAVGGTESGGTQQPERLAHLAAVVDASSDAIQIGRASCRERV